jgi:uncharacterized phage protein (TIGR01671 family)
MNRIIKFRAWDKLEKRFIYPNQGYQGHYVLDLNGRFQNLQNGSGGDEYVVQQWTGLKDSRGVEIYEGDSVTLTFDLEKLKSFYKGSEETILSVIMSRVKDKKYTGVVYFDNKSDVLSHFSYYVGDIQMGSLKILVSSFEVVGNIFELPCNPDHNGECLVCDEPLDGCPFNKN